MIIREKTARADAGSTWALVDKEGTELFEKGSLHRSTSAASQGRQRIVGDAPQLLRWLRFLETR